MSSTREYQVILYRSGTAGTITYRGSSTSKVVDYKLDWTECHPKRLDLVLNNEDVTSTVNLLNSSCAVWSNSVTGALAIGDDVQFGLYQSDGNTVDVLFKGDIVNIESVGMGQIRLTVHDKMKKLDYIKRDYVHYANVVDRDFYEVKILNGWRYLHSVTETNIAYPLMEVAYAHTDAFFSLAGGETNDTPNYTHNIGTNATYYVAQSFVFEGDAFLGVQLSYVFNPDFIDSSFYAKIKVELCYDNNNTPGEAFAEALDEVYFPLGLPANPTNVEHEELSFVSVDDVPVQMQKGGRYWIKVTRNCTPDGASPYLYIYQDTKDSDYPVGVLRYKDSSGEDYDTDDFLCIRGDYTNYEKIISPDNLYLDTTNSRIWFDDTAMDETTVDDYYGSYHRGVASFYHGTITLEDIANRLLRQDTGMLPDVSANLDLTYKTFTPRGKTIGDALRQICDLFESSGTWSGYQHVMSHYTDGSSIERCKVCKRKKTTDTSSYTYSYADDSSTDSEKVIIDSPSLRITNLFRPAVVQVVGKAGDGTPLVAIRHDRAEGTGSFYTRLGGMCETYYEYDETLSNLADVNARAFGLLRGFARNTWEGSMSLSGHHILFDVDNTSDTFGSGQIITLNWSPLGISDTKFKVKRWVLSPVQTMVELSNVDTNLQYWLTRGAKEKLELFQSPVGYADTVVGSSHVDAVIAGTTLYMELCDSSGDPIDHSRRVLCTVMTDPSSTYNLKIIHGEFGLADGYSSVPIEYVKIYDSMTASSVVTNGSIDLYRTVSDIVIDERVDKFKRNRLVFEVTCKAA